MKSCYIVRGKIIEGCEERSVGVEIHRGKELMMVYHKEKFTGSI